MAGYNAFLNALGDRESNGNYAAENAYGYLGKYQFGELALRDVGYYTYDGTSANDWKGAYWTGKNGIDSKTEFLDSHSAQESAIREYMSLQWQYVKQAWAYEGLVLDGVKITVSGMLAGAHLVGAGNLTKYLLSGGDTVPADGNNVTVETYVKQFAGYKTPFSVSHGVAEKILGGSGDDKLFGRGGEDTLRGRGGDDYLNGGSRDDKLIGGGGDDILHGGSGADLFRGGGGEDTFRFTSVRQSLPGSDHDSIRDFHRNQDDVIDLRRIDADTDGNRANQAFKFIGSKKFHKTDGELRSAKHLVQGDVDGDGKADFEIHTNVSKLHADDFIL